MTCDDHKFPHENSEFSQVSHDFRRIPIGFSPKQDDLQRFTQHVDVGIEAQGRLQVLGRPAWDGLCQIQSV